MLAIAVIAGSVVAVGARLIAPFAHDPPAAIAATPPRRADVPAIPDVAVAQAAYDQAKAAAEGRHIEGLKIDNTDCSRIDSGRFLCQIRYARDDEANGRLHFTVVTLARDDNGWTLTSGLCRGDGSIAR